MTGHKTRLWSHIPGQDPGNVGHKSATNVSTLTRKLETDNLELSGLDQAPTRGMTVHGSQATSPHYCDIFFHIIIVPFQC